MHYFFFLFFNVHQIFIKKEPLYLRASHIWAPKTHFCFNKPHLVQGLFWVIWQQLRYIAVIYCPNCSHSSKQRTHLLLLMFSLPSLPSSMSFPLFSSMWSPSPSLICLLLLFHLFFVVATDHKLSWKMNIFPPFFVY